MASAGIVFVKLVALVPVAVVLSTDVTGAVDAASAGAVVMKGNVWKDKVVTVKLVGDEYSVLLVTGIISVLLIEENEVGSLEDEV